MRCRHEWTENKTTIYVEGLSRKVSLVHLTDQHIAEVDQRDADHFASCERRRVGWADECATTVGRPASTALAFVQSMAAVRAYRPDLVALTGDVIDFPSQASVELMRQATEAVDAPILYVPGNHDWAFPDECHVTSGHLRAGYPAGFPYYPYVKTAARAAEQAGVLQFEIHNLQFLLVDNSTYQVTNEQMEAVLAFMAKGMPTVILQHIPLSLPGLRQRTMQEWHAPILMADSDWPLESREQWGAGEDLPSTHAYASLLSKADNLVAVLCGHVHFCHAEFISPHAVQYVGAPGYRAQINYLELRPMPQLPDPR